MLSVGSETTEYVTAYICPSPSPCTTLVHHHPMPCVSPSLVKQAHLILVLSQPEQFKILIFSSLPCHSVSTPLHFHYRKCPFVLVKAVKIRCGPYLLPIDPSDLSAPLGTGVPTTPKGEAPDSPISSSAPPTQRSTPLSHPRVTQRPSRPFSTSKTFISSRITSTTKGNTVSHV